MRGKGKRGSLLLVMESVLLVIDKSTVSNGENMLNKGKTKMLPLLTNWFFFFKEPRFQKPRECG